MGASSSSDGPSTSISTSERAAETSSYAEDVRLTNNERQRTYVGTSVCKEEDRPRSQLTYPKQITGWQCADDHNFAMCQQYNEIVELSRIVSQLAMTNHQLASTHNATLTRMETMYVELSKHRENQKRETCAEIPETCDDVLRKRLRDAIEDVGREETRRLEQRVVRLERLLATNSVGRCKQIDPQEDNSKKTIEKSRSKIERLEDKTDDRSRSRCELSKQERTTEVPDECDGDEETDVCSCNVRDSEINVPRIDEDSCSANVDLNNTRRRRARLRLDNEQKNSTTRDSASEDVLELSREVERSRTDRMERENSNERLLRRLADQKNQMEKLSADHEELKTRYAVLETNLDERKQQHDELTKNLDSAKKENERLLKEIDDFQSERSVADARTSILEQDLRKSLLENERMKDAEDQKTSQLRAQLSEEISNKEKQSRALEDALREIQRLREIMKTERRSENNVASNDNVDVVNSTNDGPESAAANMEKFKKELTLKREARHRAIAAVSSEMERLRKELDAEKEAHSETSSMLAFLQSAHSSGSQNLANCAKSTNREERERLDESGRELRRAEAQRLTSILKVSDELRNNIRYQIEKVDDLRYQLETDSERHRNRIQCLAEVASRTRESLFARERRTNELKDHLAQMSARLGDRSPLLEDRDEADTECDRQLESINALKSLYNERLRILAELKDSTVKELTDAKQKLEYAVKKSENLEEELKKAEEKVDAQDTEITNLESQLGLTKADCRDLQNQMSLINGLFTQMLLGASSADMDLDRLTRLLQENHDLISDIAREESTEAAALPKLLLDLIEQVEGGKAKSQNQTPDEENSVENGEVDRKEDDLHEENIAHNLPKVWRVLFELLSCHAVTSPSVSVASCSDPNSCYKSVDTPAGPRLVISVSKTYIRLKELILEKKHLEKEMNRMKQLNTHLESKLSEQEKRLSMVSTELAKTWNIVGRMQAQHQQLHTHEEILRYELQQKRKMLQELKQELEYCREKWESARQKNTNTELEWRSLRREFAARKALAARDFFNSAESGFSDERGDDTDEEEDAIEERIRHGPRRRARKENPRAPTPDTESEQPTDTELSESKTGSLEQRTPTPEIEAELDLESVNVETESARVAESTQETLDPLDRALTNVIQNLIRVDDSDESGRVTQTISRENTAIPFEDPRDDSILETGGCATESSRATTSKTDDCDRNTRLWTPSAESWSSLPAKTLKRTATSIDLPSAVDDDGDDVNESIGVTNSKKSDDVSSAISPASSTATSATSTTPVFVIGPLPTSTVPSSSIKSVQFSDPLIVGPSNRLVTPVFGVAVELENSASTIQSSSMTRQEDESTEEQHKKQRFPKPMESVADFDSVSVDSSSSLDTVRDFSTAETSISSREEKPQGSGATTTRKEDTETAPSKSRTPEEVLATRADRLKRLEEQADWLMKKMNATSKRGNALCTRLEELHETYGEPPVPPPMPDVLPSRRLPCSLLDLPRQVPESPVAGAI
ncbi:putative protein tag-278 isoform X2 [Pseudomyrmex gracilis]|nr:putative protein tag-278 isoform X2 [Pseudomyrmex gracilis]